MNAKHTPGPWIVASDKTSVLAITPVDMDDQRPCPKVVDCASGYDAMSYDEAQANARLIAAAPDLLVVAEQALAAFSYLGIRATTKEDREEFKRRELVARDAIAKATGSQS